jgi:NAD(P)-dependent dehydrogenase (short-subunit alcohol dehydrogenase family)
MNLGEQLAGKRILISGASSGLGAHFARVSARCGARIAIAARRKDRLADLADELIALGAADAEALDLDVRQPDSIEACAAAAFDRFDGLDVLVNNAGVASEGWAIDQTVDDYDRVIDTNLRGVWLLATACGRRWINTGACAAVINVASVLGLRVAKGLGPYAISKAGVIQMTRALALEWANKNIRVNALAPGYFSTEINAGFLDSEAGRKLVTRVPMHRIGETDELTGPFLLLATQASSYMTGVVLSVDGGHANNSV